MAQNLYVFAYQQDATSGKFYTRPQVTGGSQNVGTTRCGQSQHKITFRHVSERYMRKMNSMFRFGSQSQRISLCRQSPKSGGKNPTQPNPNQNNNNKSPTTRKHLWSRACHTRDTQPVFKSGVCGTLVGLLKCRITLFIFASQWHRKWALGMFMKRQTRQNLNPNVPKYCYHGDHFLFSMFPVLWTAMGHNWCVTLSIWQRKWEGTAFFFFKWKTVLFYYL